MAQVVIKINEEELVNGKLRFTSHISFKSGGINIKYDRPTPSFDMEESTPMSDFVDKVEVLKAEALKIGNKVNVEEAVAIQKKARKMMRQDFKKTGTEKVSIFK